MGKSLKEMLQRAVNKDNFSKDGNDVFDFKDTAPTKTLPDSKKYKTIKGKPDQCFVLIPDVHSFDRDKKAFNLMMKSLPILNEHYNVTKFVQLGDLLECRQFSSHAPSTVLESTPEYSEELKWAVDEFWNPAKKMLPNANFYAITGNHENRIDKWLANRLGRNDISIQVYNEMLASTLWEDMGIHVTHYGREDINEGVLQLHKGLIAVHGWTTAKNAAAGHLSKVGGGHSVVFGHTHRMQSEIMRDPVTNAYIRSYSFGSLCKVSMKWHNGNPMNHTLGFGLVFTYGDQFFVKTQEILMDGDKRCLLLPTGDLLEE